MHGKRFDLLAVGNIAFEDVFKVDRIPSFEGTGLILGTKTHFGGRAGNIALPLSYLGLKVAVAAFVGEDFEKSCYKQALISNHVNIDKIHAIRGKESPRSIVFYAPKGKMFRFFEPIDSSASTLNLRKVDFEHCAILYITAFDGEDSIRQIIKEANGVVKTVVVGLGEEVTRKNANFLRRIINFGDYLFLNNFELKILLERLGLSDTRDLILRSERLNSVVVTEGNLGSTLYKKDETLKIPPVFPDQIVNTLGAGDAYVAGFILGLTKNYEAAKCAKLGSTLSSFALEQEGAQPYQIGVPMVKERFKLSFPQEDVLF